MSDSLTADQINHYLDYIAFPPHLRQRLGQQPDLAFLSALLTHHVCAFPYENLDLHYAAYDPPSIPIDICSIFEKSTGPRGRGGYCMENNILFNHVIRALGFSAYLTGARARPRVNGVPMATAGYTGWMHVVNIVTLPSSSPTSADDDSTPTKYMVDVGFGGDMATVPVPLIAPFSPIIHNNIGTQEIRLEYGRIPGMRAPADQKVWIYQARNGPDQPWFSAFCFTETEFLEQDLEVLNWHTSRDPRCFQTNTLLVVRLLMGEGENVCGKVMLVNEQVKENLGGKTQVVKTCRTEEERVEVLEKVFGISLTDQQREGIKGKAVEIEG